MIDLEWSRQCGDCSSRDACFCRYGSEPAILYQRAKIPDKCTRLDNPYNSRQLSLFGSQQNGAIALETFFIILAGLGVLVMIIFFTFANSIFNEAPPVKTITAPTVTVTVTRSTITVTPTVTVYVDPVK